MQSTGSIRTRMKYDQSKSHLGWMKTQRSAAHSSNMLQCTEHPLSQKLNTKPQICDGKIIDSLGYC